MPTTDDILTLAAWALLALGIVVLVRFAVGDRPKGRRRCPKCWYDMSASAGMKCSECGKAQKREKRFFKTRRRKRIALLCVLMLAGAYASFMTPKVRRDGIYRYLPTWSLIMLAPPRVPESPFDGAYPSWDAFMDVTLSGELWGHFSANRIPTRQDRALRELQQRQFVEGEFNRVERWLWITRDRWHGPDDGEFRMILDLETLWEPHSLDLMRIGVEPNELSRARSVGSFLNRRDEGVTDLPGSVTELADSGFGIRQSQIAEMVAACLMRQDDWFGYGSYCLHDWAQAFRLDLKDDEQFTASIYDSFIDIESSYEHAHALEAYTFGRYLVVSGDAGFEESIQFLIYQLLDPIALSHSVNPMSNAELQKYPEEVEIRRLVAMDGAIRQHTEWIGTASPLIERVYDFSSLFEKHLNKDHEPMVPYALRWDQVVQRYRPERIFPSNRTDASFDLISSSRYLGTSVAVFAPLEYHSVIVESLVRSIEDTMPPPDEYLVFRDGQLVPWDETPSK